MTRRPAPIPALLVGLLVLLAAAPVDATSASATSHPFHEGAVDARVDEARGVIECTIRLDAAHLERLVSKRAGRPIDLGASAADDPGVARALEAVLRADFEMRAILPQRGGERDLRTTPLEWRWIGYELEGTECFAYVALALPPPPSRAPGENPVPPTFKARVRCALMSEEVSRQVNLVTVLHEGRRVGLRFSPNLYGWQTLSLPLPWRTPAPASAVAAGGTPGPGAPSLVLIPPAGVHVQWWRALAETRAERMPLLALQWPGLDGELAPPAGGAAGDGAWLDWAARSVVARLEADDVRRAVLVGDGSGAMLAEAVARLVPTRVAGVLAIDAGRMRLEPRAVRACAEGSLVRPERDVALRYETDVTARQQAGPTPPTGLAVALPRDAVAAPTDACPATLHTAPDVVAEALDRLLARVEAGRP